jgi:beta-N-acetylhexosaminidase
LLLAAFAQVLLAALGLAGSPRPEPVDGVDAMTPREKAAFVVVSGLPAPEGVGGVLVQPWSRTMPRPRGTLVFVDQEGGGVRAFSLLPPAGAASSYRTRAQAFAAGRATGRALRADGVDVDLAPVLDLAGGPLGPRHFRSSALGLAFARGLSAGGALGCAKHFPGLGTAEHSTDTTVFVPARIVPRELRGFRRAVDAGIPCVMTSHAVYRPYGMRRAITAPRAYRTLRLWGFDGVAITDSLSIFRSGPWPVRWAKQALRAGADLVLYTSAAQASRAIDALVPLAERGELDEHVQRVLELRRRAGLGGS